MISIIIPNFNEEKYIPYFLRSLADQYFKSFELIVVDGGSTDGSRKLFDGYRGKFDILGLINETRNMGFVRNLGAKAARGNILLFTNSDVILPRNLLLSISLCFSLADRLQAITGRTVALNSGALGFSAHMAFDLLRWAASKVGVFVPSGNLLAVRSDAFWAAGGFPLARVNEDGLLGSRLQALCKQKGWEFKFAWHLSVRHWAKRFQGKSLKTLLFYGYVFGNLHPFIRSLIQNIEARSGEKFSAK